VAPLIWLIINLFLGELKLKMPFNLWRILSQLSLLEFLFFSN
jgi:hypothetical protein